MTSPISNHMYGQMQHKEYEAQANRRLQRSGTQPRPIRLGQDSIMGKIAKFLQAIRQQATSKPVGETIAATQ